VTSIRTDRTFCSRSASGSSSRRKLTRARAARPSGSCGILGARWQEIKPSRPLQGGAAEHRRQYSRLVTGEPLGMFEAIYAGAEAGAAKPPWDYGAPRPQLVEWAEALDLAGDGREALVVGCGYGADAEFVALLGFRTTAFDFSPAAIAAARRKHPDTQATYLVADVLDLPREWQGRFDLVIESLTVQSMPPEQHTVAARNIAGLVAPQGTLLVLATTREEDSPVTGPPWPLTRSEVEAFASDDLVLRGLERIENGSWWRAELTRWAEGWAKPSP
jgi:SAM-dependent methyltransferase